MITTVIPVYNGERYLPETIESLLAQTRPTDRLIVLDNCSTDGTREVFEKYRQPGFEWHQNERNLGQIGNLNKAHDFASETDYLHVLTDDDPVTPKFYETMVNALKDAPPPSVAYSAFEVVDGEGKPRGENADFKCFFPIEPGAPPHEISKNAFLANQSELHTVLVPAVLYKSGRKPCAARFLPDLVQIGDCAFYADMGRACRRIFEVPEILCHYRRHEHSVTSKNQFNIEHWALAELRVMLEVAGHIDEGALSAFLRRQRLLCYFAARSIVKVKSMRAVDDAHASEIRKRTRAEVSWIHWLLGKLAVIQRDGLG
jgi:glycosyltransferase involved in cell wall biosynthesis